ncbi:MAG: hypothetical protein AAFY91_00470 [Bacteroidota bacterium]
MDILDRNNELAKTARRWANNTRKELLFKLASLGLAEMNEMKSDPDKRQLYETVSTIVKMEFGIVEYVGFRFLRHGIFVEQGVGRGRKKGSAQASKLAQPWIKPVLEPSIPVLADMLVEEYADLLVDEMRFLIPGVMDIKVGGGRQPKSSIVPENNEFKVQ